MPAQNGRLKLRIIRGSNKGGAICLRYPSGVSRSRASRSKTFFQQISFFPVSMHIHILGICGAFMGGLAALARAAGYHVTGCEADVYPPMSTQLQAQGIELLSGHDPAQLFVKADLTIEGNAITRGNALMDAFLDQGLPYISGPQWLAEHVLSGKWVLAVAGTHGKTTTAAVLAWLLDDAQLNPGFLVGGVPLNFGASARWTESNFFVIEADEYDTAFFDKRSKFVHYR